MIHVFVVYETKSDENIKKVGRVFEKIVVLASEQLVS